MSTTAAARDKNAPVYNLKAVVVETGLKPPTIRAWERRYGLPQPQRTEGGHRLYTQHDMDMLKWLVARQAEGMSISHAVELWRTLAAQGTDPLLERETATFTVPAAASQHYLETLGTEISELRQAWIGACLEFDRPTSEQVLARAFALFAPEVVAVEILQAGLSEIGQLWYEGQISVQQEHFTSAMSVQRLEMLIAAAPPPMRPQRIIVASAQDDYHVFSPLLITYLLRRRGWDVLYLGADVPVAEIGETIAQTQAQLLVISSQMLTTAASIIDMAAALKASGTSIAYGGLIFNMKPELQAHIAAHYLGPTVEGAVDVIEQLIQKRPPHPATAEPDPLYVEALQQYERRLSLIESQIWSGQASAGKSTGRLAEINLEMARIINAALKFGDSEILSHDMAWIQYLMTSFHLSRSEVIEYIDLYYRAAKANLSGSSQIIIDWLAELNGR